MTGQANAIRQASAAGRARWWALAVVSLATLMSYLDNNVTNVAIPTIQRNLHLSVSGLEWIVSSYLLVFAGLLLIGGRAVQGLGAALMTPATLAIITATFTDVRERTAAIGIWGAVGALGLAI